jgi:hypothetical protein
MVNQCPFLFETLLITTFPFQQHLKTTCDLLPPRPRTCLLHVEQLIIQQMVHFQDSISKCLHHHTLFNMLFDEIFEVHCACMLSCFDLGVGAWFITWPIFSTFQLSSPIFSTMLWMWLKLLHLLIACLPWCECTHPIDPMGILLLCRAHNNECIGTHDAIHDIFVAIARDASFHMGWKQLHVLPLATRNSSYLRVNIMLTKSAH